MFYKSENPRAKKSTGVFACWEHYRKDFGF